MSTPWAETAELTDALARAAATSAGVVQVDRGANTLTSRAWGLADRRHAVPMTPEHRVAIASGSKAFTALAVLSLVADGELRLDTRARDLLGADLPLIDDAVTIEHLLAHRSGIGEYLDDEADYAEYAFTVPMSSLVGPEDYLPVLGGFPQRNPPGETYEYCNGGYIVLSLLAERASGVPFHELVRSRVLAPAGLTATDYLRSDALPGDAAVGYIEIDGALRTTVHHLPVIGGGDGGAYTTAHDMHAFWRALLAGRIIPARLTQEALVPRSDEDGFGFGWGFCRPPYGGVSLMGEDAGASFWSWHDPDTSTSATVLATTDEGAWFVVPTVKRLLGLP